jgi:hypothetical protein
MVGMLGPRLSLTTPWASCVIVTFSSIVLANIQECAEHGASSCPSSLARVGAESVADSVSEQFGAEGEEEVNDADYAVHMQMRLTVDLPTEGDKEPTIHATALSSFGAGNDPHAAPHHSENDVLAMLAGPATLHKSPAEPLLPTAQSASGSNLFLSIVVCALLVVVGILVGTLIWTLKKERQAKDQAELKAAAKAWMLDWALGFEPDGDLEVTEDKVMKVPVHKKKAPPMPNENESSDTDEEEPEAESESEPACELEEAVYQAAQVEVANNEALDDHYGLKPEVVLADQIDQIVPDSSCV